MSITVSMNGALKCRPGSVTGMQRLAEPHHQRLLGHVHGEDRTVADDQDDEQHEQRDNACDGGSHRTAPLCSGGPPVAGRRRTASRRQLVQRQIGHDALPDEPPPS